MMQNERDDLPSTHRTLRTSENQKSQSQKKTEPKKFRAKMLLQVHDELVFEIEDKYLDESIPQIKNIIQNDVL